MQQVLSDFVLTIFAPSCWSRSPTRHGIGPGRHRVNRVGKHSHVVSAVEELMASKVVASKQPGPWHGLMVNKPLS